VSPWVGGGLDDEAWVGGGLDDEAVLALGSDLLGTSISGSGKEHSFYF
jgi:hypothetical protein